MKTTLVYLFLFITFAAQAQIPDHVYKPNIHSVKLFKYGDIYGYPIINLKSGEQLELAF